MSTLKPTKCIFTFLILLISSACVQYKPKAVQVPLSKEWKASLDEEGEKTKCPEKQMAKYMTLSPWWQVFQDPFLNQLEEEALVNSPTLQLAFYKLKEAQEFYISERASLFPFLDVNADAFRGRIPQSTFVGSAFGGPQLNQGAVSPFLSKGVSSPLAEQSSPSVSANGQNQITQIENTGGKTKSGSAPINNSNSASTSVSLNPCRTFLQVLPEISYEVDLWGKYAQASQAAFMNAKAYEEELKVAHLQLTSTIASAYFQLRAIDADLDILRKIIAVYENQVVLQEDLYQAGKSAETDLLQVKATLASAMADFESTKTSRRIQENSLAVLLGKVPSEFSVREVHEFSPVMPYLPSQLASSVLQSRPDVRQNEAIIEEARLLAGVQKTAFFPDITLGLGAGFASNRANSLFHWKNRVWQATCDISQNIFAAGRTSADYRAAKARYKQVVSSYINTVLTAYQEVENALYSTQTKAEQYTWRNKEFLHYKDYADLTYDQYQAGLVTYFFVIVADQQALLSARLANSSKLEQVLAHVLLIKSIGGTW